MLLLGQGCAPGPLLLDERSTAAHRKQQQAPAASEQGAEETKDSERGKSGRMKGGKGGVWSVRGGEEAWHGWQEACGSGRGGRGRGLALKLVGSGLGKGQKAFSST